MIVIPDTQVREDVPTKHLIAAGNYIAEKEPDAVFHLGDHWDFPSLNFHSKKIEVEGTRIIKDINAGNDGLDKLTNGIKQNTKARPRLVLLRGNHEDRLTRAIADDPKLQGLVGFNLFNDVKLGWEVHSFLEVVEYEDILFSHYYYNPMTSRAWGGDARYKLAKIHRSFVMGHVQGLSTAILEIPNGKRLRGLVSGSFYEHSENYIGPQGNSHWRGILVLNEVRDGNYDLLEVSLPYLLRKYT